MNHIKYNVNLIKNESGKEGLLHWSLLPPSEPICDDYLFLEYYIKSMEYENILDYYKNNVVKDPLLIESHPWFTDGNKFCSSYYLSQKFQIIDLYEEGFSREIIEKSNTWISVSEMYKSHYCGCQYCLSVTLLNDQFEPIDNIYFDDRLHANSDLQTSTHIFEDYPSNLRYIVYYHNGKDTAHWDGYYGVQISNSCVKVFNDL